ncbi:MAG TPA: FAD-dependent oxidoreductase [Actinophytocola sp.]|uniref:NAD(P)/FAD-dependent oxidoreductase n=1 Tax=Actinophytocola sp. TaxID=1872138 RepID=UPI002DBE9DDC|nr:FAD-dependent oxidoreductase [Actinophytocola sp.]HEU5471511.1 FAD-dependent oxidoreductase [Actinophytocola sp.]
MPAESKRERIVIVGAGAAGLRAAERLREQSFDGELVIVSEEPYRPYHRPAVNKQLLTGAMRPKDCVLPLHTDLDATWRYASRATRLDPDEHIVTLPGDERIRYDGLVIATGSQARHLPGAPRHDPRVQVLRTVADAAAVRRAIAHGRGGVAVVGGGFVGCEVASAVVSINRQATIITREDRLLDRIPGVNLGDAVADLHRSKGVRVITETTVQEWVSKPEGVAMYLSNGQVVVASCVVLGIGTVPVVDWLRGSGLILDDGIMCDATCHAVGASDIVVAGDVARWPNLLFDSVPRRVEHWLHAIEMGRAAADSLLAGSNAEPFTPVPRFWSEQHGIRIQAAGVLGLAQETEAVGNRVTGYLSNGSMVGVVGWDNPRGMLRWTDELDHQLTTAMNRRLDRPTVRDQLARFAETPPFEQPAMFADTQQFPVPMFTEPPVVARSRPPMPPAPPVAPVPPPMAARPPLAPAMSAMPPVPPMPPRPPVMPRPVVPVAQPQPVPPAPPVPQPVAPAEPQYADARFVELPLPEDVVVPDVVPDMSTLGPAEMSLPNIPLPPELAAIGAARARAEQGDPGLTSVQGIPPVLDHRSPAVRDLFR